MGSEPGHTALKEGLGWPQLGCEPEPWPRVPGLCQPPGVLSTFQVLVLELREEARDAIRGDGKGDAGSDLERVDADDLAVLVGRSGRAITAGAPPATALSREASCPGPELTWLAAALAEELPAAQTLSWEGTLGSHWVRDPTPHPVFLHTRFPAPIAGVHPLGKLSACPSKQCPLTQDTPGRHSEGPEPREGCDGDCGEQGPPFPSFRKQVGVSGARAASLTLLSL